MVLMVALSHPGVDVKHLDGEGDRLDLVRRRDVKVKVGIEIWIRLLPNDGSVEDCAVAIRSLYDLVVSTQRESNIRVIVARIQLAVIHLWQVSSLQDSDSEEVGRLRLLLRRPCK